MEKYIKYLATFSLFVCLFFFINHPKVFALSSYPYNPSNLISDSLFTNSNTMNASSIQTFLVNENSGLKNLSFVENCNPSTPTQPYNYTYYPNCGQTVSAATIIYDASQAYKINPQVILATLEKEQSLVTTPNPTQSQLDCAMGYNSCNNYSGFFVQVDNATWQFRLYIEQMEGLSWWGFSPSSYMCSGQSSLYSSGLIPGNNVTFYDPYYANDPVSNGAYTLTINNIATAALYCYTPYVGPLNQTGYSGSYNFVEYFESWFGDTQVGANIIPANDAVYRLYNSQTGDHFITASASEADLYAQDGWFYDGIVAHYDSSGGTVPVYRLFNGSTGQHYYTTSATVVSQYQSNGWYSDGIIFYGDSSGAPVWELQRNDNYFVTSSSNEFSTYLAAGWHSDGILYYQPTNYIHPVWRLFNSYTGDHFYTASPQELTTYLAAGWHNDGVVFQGSSSGTPVYRLFNGSTGQHYYTTSATVVSQYQSNGWYSDGIIFYVSNTGTPVYLLTQGDKNFLSDNSQEISTYISDGWQNQGIIFYTDNIVAARRLYQPSTGSHMTVSNISNLWKYAVDGWYDDGIQFYVSQTYGTWVWQLYNPVLNSYFYTTTQNEFNTYLADGWQSQGVAFSAPPGGNEAVYRLYNPNNFTHILIGSEQNELQAYLDAGWTSDGIIFNTYDSTQL